MPDAITDLDRTSERYQHHASHPEVTFLDYLETRMVVHARSFADRKIVYLDTKFWIKLCNAALNQPKALPEDYALLLKLRGAVAAGKVVCPFSTPVWFEVFHQSDPNTRLATARLIDELSLGLTSVDEKDRIATELGILVRIFLFKQPFKRSAADLVWAVPFCALGFPFVGSPDWPEADAVTIQKTLLDQVWDAKFADIASGTLDLSTHARVALAQGAAELNAFRASRPVEDSLFKEHAREFVGALRNKRQLLAEVIAVESSRHFNAPLPWSVDHYSELARRFSGKLLDAFLYGRLGNALPSLEIPTAIHAAMGRSLTRRYKDNDYHDIAHATVALPYCDCFATERSLAHLLINELKYDARFECVVVNSSSALLDYLDQRAAPSAPAP